jgi:hypothetical protein
LESLNVSGNALTSLALPSGLTHLTGLFLVSNQLTNLTLPPDMTNLASLSFLANPLTTLVLSEPLAASTNLAVNLTTIASLRNQGISVFTYPLAVRLLSPTRNITGAFELTLTGPPGLYSVLGTADLSAWHEVGIATNVVGSIRFTDLTTILSQRRFYRALLRSSPANAAFSVPSPVTSQ